MLSVQPCHIGLPRSTRWSTSRFLSISPPFKFLRFHLPKLLCTGNTICRWRTCSSVIGKLSHCSHIPSRARWRCNWLDRRKTTPNLRPKFPHHPIHFRHPSILSSSLGQTQRHLPYPTILVVTFDPMFSFSRHIQNILSCVRERTKILKALAGTNWVQQKVTLILTYQALI